MTLFIVLYALTFVSLLIASYKYIDLDDAVAALLMWIACSIWPVSVPVTILAIIIRKIHKLLLKM